MHQRRFSLSTWQNLWRKLSLEERVRVLRRVLPFVVVILVALHQWLTAIFFDATPNLWHSLFEWFVYGLTGVAVVWFGFGWMAKAIARRERDAAKLQKAMNELAQIQQQLLSIHEMGSQAVNAVDPLEVFQIAARAPIQIAGAGGAAVLMFDKDRVNLEMTWGLGESFVHALQARAAQGIPAERCRGCVPLTARIKSDCPLFVGTRAQAEAEHFASLTCLPLARGQDRVGVVTGFFASPDGPPESQLALLNVAAAEIAVALEGVRLRSQQLAALSQVGQHLPSSQLDEFLEQVLSAILTGWQGDAGALLLYDAEEGAWSDWAQRGLGSDSTDARFELAFRLSEKARGSRRTVVWTPDAAQNAPFATALAVPLQADGEVIGVVFLASPRSRTWTVRQMSFVNSMAQQVALAIRNAQLHQRLGHLAVLEERNRLSREMHDGLAQTLSSLGWQMDHLAALAESGRFETLATELVDARQNVREAYLDLREAIDGLRITVDHPGGLSAALEEYVQDFSERNGVAVEFESHGVDADLSPDAGLQLLRLAQEALTNVRKHSGAKNARVVLNCDGVNWQLSICDDGRGFDPMTPRLRRHWGMVTMRERVQALGGYLTIGTAPGEGTRITATMPVAQTSLRSGAA